MEYQLEIYRPGMCDGDSCIKSFAATAPFFSIRAGDLLNTKTWEKLVEWPLLRVVNVEHLISEASHGIDPAGRLRTGSCFIPKMFRMPSRRDVNRLGKANSLDLEWSQLPELTSERGDLT